MLIFRVIGTVNTSVDAVIGQIQRSKHYNPVSVKFLLDLFCQAEHFLCQFRIFALQKCQSFPVIKAFKVPGALQKRFHISLIFFMLLRIL